MYRAIPHGTLRALGRIPPATDGAFMPTFAFLGAARKSSALSAKGAGRGVQVRGRSTGPQLAHEALNAAEEARALWNGLDGSEEKGYPLRN